MSLESDRDYGAHAATSAVRAAISRKRGESTASRCIIWLYVFSGVAAICGIQLEIVGVFILALLAIDDALVNLLHRRHAALDVRHKFLRSGRRRLLRASCCSASLCEFIAATCGSRCVCWPCRSCRRCSRLRRNS